MIYAGVNAGGQLGQLRQLRQLDNNLKPYFKLLLNLSSIANHPQIQPYNLIKNHKNNKG